MAKIVNCSFCGEEVTKGFFSGDDCSLFVGTVKTITCCPKCYKKYKNKVNDNKDRFLIKLENMKKAKKSKLTEKDIAQAFATYIEEKEKQYSKISNAAMEHLDAFFIYDDKGRFSVREYGKGLGNLDITAKDMVKSFTEAAETDCHFFDKNDITKIEYAKNNAGSFDGLFHKVYSFAIRLNDESVMTYKPCVTRTASVGAGFMFGYQKSAEKKLLEQLELFKEVIGSDLPIVKVKKI